MASKSHETELIDKALLDKALTDLNSLFNYNILTLPKILASNEKEKRLQFSVYHPTKITTEAWSTLLAYIDLGFCPISSFKMTHKDTLIS